MPKTKSSSGGESTASGAAANSAPSTPLCEHQQALVASGDLLSDKEPLAIAGKTMKLEVKPDANESHAPLKQVDVECMLLQDTSTECAPLHLSQLLKHFDAAKCTQAEMLLLLLYTVSLESGFIMHKEYTKCCNLISDLPPTSSFHSKNVLLLTRAAPAYTHDADKLHFELPLRLLVNVTAPQPKMISSVLTAMVTGDFMIVTLSPDATLSDVRGYSICLSIPRYVLGTPMKGKPAQSRFRKLDELTLQARNGLFVPMRNQQLALLDVEIYPSLLGLPTELYDEIFQYLSVNQRNIVANLNRLLRDLVRTSRLPTPEQNPPLNVETSIFPRSLRINPF